MITFEQISGEISILEQEKPTHAVMQKLAALYTVRDHMIIQNAPAEPAVVISEVMPDIGSESDFAKAVSGKPMGDFLKVIDELMTTLQAINPRLYESVMQRL